jgi:hypothetical protein
MLKMAEMLRLGQWESVEEKEEAQEKEVAKTCNRSCVILNMLAGGGSCLPDQAVPRVGSVA